MSDVTVFEDRDSSGDQNSSFMEWIQANPFGWYLNRKTNKTAVLHTTKCQHKWEEHGSNTTHPKVCDLSKSKLEKWAKENGVKITRCKDC